MIVTFRNNSTSNKIIVTVENHKYTLEAQESRDIFCRNSEVIFDAECCAFDELHKIINEPDFDDEKNSLKDRILKKLSIKFAEKLPDAVLDISIKYKADFSQQSNAVIEFDDGAYSVCDGNVADFFMLSPVVYVFARAETATGSISVVDTSAKNRKVFLKLMRKILVLAYWHFIILDVFSFIPDYCLIKFYSSHFYIKKLFAGLYKKSPQQRGIILFKNAQKRDSADMKKGCLSAIIKVIIVLLIAGGICYWAVTSPPDVVVSADFQTVECFDETFVRINSGLPSDAKDAFLQEYTAYYPLEDGGYDMDNYYCYIYETPDGGRYMWLKDNCSNEENSFREYADYKDPLVYKSIE